MLTTTRTRSQFTFLISLSPQNIHCHSCPVIPLPWSTTSAWQKHIILQHLPASIKQPAITSKQKTKTQHHIPSKYRCWLKDIAKMMTWLGSKRSLIFSSIDFIREAQHTLHSPHESHIPPKPPLIHPVDSQKLHKLPYSPPSYTLIPRG